jgi:two-component system, NarL family, nitrate/nitrite response regulator NarL
MVTYVTLTQRERETLAHLAQGLSNKEIARVLGLSTNTVNHHVQSILGKMNARNRVQAAVMATEEQQTLAS